ncbi:MAG: stage III sporulation protein AA [Desulfotomaculales bacterium]
MQKVRPFSGQFLSRQMQAVSFAGDENGLPGQSRASWQEILPYLPPALKEIVCGLPAEVLNQLEEIRLRQNKPLIVGLPGEDRLVGKNGMLVSNWSQAYLVTEDDIQRVIQLVSGCSLYAFEEELKNGFITLPGGHRVGLAGRAVVENGRVKTIKHITSINIRLSREVAGVVEELLPYLIDRKTANIYHTLIFSPPRCGKTTLLRDLVRQISNGVPELNIPGLTVGLVDERSELAGCYRGVPQRDVGIRTDVLDGCPKAEGMIMLLRAMSPQVIATDEIGSREDVAALEEVFNAGVKVLVTVHASSLAELASRPSLNYLLGLKVIERFVLLGRSSRIGTVEEIIDGKTLVRLKGRRS